MSRDRKSIWEHFYTLHFKDTFVTRTVERNLYTPLVMVFCSELTPGPGSIRRNTGLGSLKNGQTQFKRDCPEEVQTLRRNADTINFRD